MSKAAAQAYERIRNLIVEGGAIPGARLKEEELTDLCGVSRTPVREALRRLAAEGLVVVSPNHGAQVAALAAEELAEIYALRAMLEGHAAARAATRMTPETLAELKRLAAEMEAAIAGRADFENAFLAINSEFHRLILEAADSPRLTAMAAMVVEIPLIVRTLSRYSAHDFKRSVQHHRELIDAFEAGDGDWARSTMASHVLAASHAVMRPVRGEA